MLIIYFTLMCILYIGTHVCVYIYTHMHIYKFIYAYFTLASGVYHVCYKHFFQVGALVPLQHQCVVVRTGFENRQIACSPHW